MGSSHDQPTIAHLIGWQSKVLQRVCNSTLSAESQQALKAYDVGLWTQKMIEEMFGASLPIDLRLDAKSVQTNATSTKASDDKRVAIDMAYVKEALRDKELRSVEHISGTVNYADRLTKFNDIAMLARFRQMMSSGRIVDVG